MVTSICEHDGYLRVWDAVSTLRKSQEIYVGSAYLTSLCQANNKFYVGLSAGFLAELDSDFKIIRKKKVQNDCIAAMFPSAEKLLTIGFDGRISELDIQSL